MLGVKLDQETFTSSLTRLCVWLTRTVLALARGCWLAQSHRCAPWTVTPELPRSAAAPGAATAAADRDAAGSSISPAASEASPAMAASLRTRGGRRTVGRLMAAPDFRCRAADHGQPDRLLIPAPPDAPGGAAAAGRAAPAPSHRSSGRW